MEVTPELLDQLAQLNRMTPKRDDRVLFVGHMAGHFAGNVKYLFLHAVQHAPELNPTYLAFHHDLYRELRAAGLPTVLFPNMGSLKAAASAGTVVVDDFHYKDSPLAVLLARARIIQLWHGVGFKTIGFLEADSSIDLSDQRRADLRRLYSGYDAVISTSPFYTEHLFQTSFGTKAIWETGYPRNDVFFRPPTKNELLGSDVDLYAQAKQASRKGPVFVYTPTFRDKGGLGLTPDVLDLAALDAALGEMNGLFIMKFHSFTGVHSELPFRNIRIMRSTDDVYPLLPLTSALITDYSSIFTDYLVMDKPVLFFPYDLDDYRKKNRELQFDYDWITPGPKCMNQQELLAAMAEVAQGGDLGFADKRREIARLAFARHDGQSCARVLERLRREIRA